MAVVEIAKIQVRRGAENQTGVPQLDGGEFAWAADTEHLYIGLKRIDGGSRDTNIRVLTENDVKSLFNIVTTGLLNTVTNYVWESDSAATITTSTSINNAYYQQVQRSVQNKLDDIVNVADFGVVPSTAEAPIDCSAALQMVIDHLYLDTDSLTTSTHWDTNNTLKYNKKLYFQSGVYRIGQTILLPRKAVLIGEGVDKTIIENITTGSGIFQTVDYVGRRTDPVNWGKFDPSTSTSVTTITGVGQPNNIHIEGMTLRYSTSTGLAPHLSLISFDCVSSGLIRNVKLQGRQASWTVLAGNVPTGIDFRGYNSLTSENILVDNCEFNGLYYGVKSNYETNHVIIQNSSFLASAYGIALSTATIFPVTLTGPNYYRAINNKFQSIEHQAIFLGTVTNYPGSHNFISENNVFVNVGNINGGTELVGAEPVIIFYSNSNLSINDYFDRHTYHNYLAYANTATVYYPLIQGNTLLDFNTVNTRALSGNVPLLRLPITGNAQTITLKYSCVAISGLTSTRMGEVVFNVRSGLPPVGITINDSADIIGTAAAGDIYWGAVVDDTSRSIVIYGYALSNTYNIEYSASLIL